MQSKGKKRRRKHEGKRSKEKERKATEFEILPVLKNSRMPIELSKRMRLESM
jgi:hypothetical protein